MYASSTKRCVAPRARSTPICRRRSCTDIQKITAMSASDRTTVSTTITTMVRSTPEIWAP